jgi:hypothetical protein
VLHDQVVAAGGEGGQAAVGAWNPNDRTLDAVATGASSNIS